MFVFNSVVNMDESYLIFCFFCQLFEINFCWPWTTHSNDMFSIQKKSVCFGWFYIPTYCWDKTLLVFWLEDSRKAYQSALQPNIFSSSSDLLKNRSRPTYRVVPSSYNNFNTLTYDIYLKGNAPLITIAWEIKLKQTRV